MVSRFYARWSQEVGCGKEKIRFAGDLKKNNFFVKRSMFIIGMFILTQIKKGWDIELKNYINTQNFYNDENYSLTEKNIGYVLCLLIGWLKLSVKKFQPIILIYKRDNLSMYNYINLLFIVLRLRISDTRLE